MENENSGKGKFALHSIWLIALMRMKALPHTRTRHTYSISMCVYRFLAIHPNVGCDLIQDAAKWNLSAFSVFIFLIDYESNRCQEKKNEEEKKVRNKEKKLRVIFSSSSFFFELCSLSYAIRPNHIYEHFSWHKQSSIERMHFILTNWLAKRIAELIENWIFIRTSYTQWLSE